MNILTFDIEEWALAKSGGYGTSKLYTAYDSCLDDLLSMLDETAVKATFFCTGAMAVDFPQVVKKIYCCGHEIGCHSYSHSWLNKMSINECKEDTFRAVDSLEQCVGEKVISYRAPAFSVDNNNLWVFDILSENGIELDSSIFPVQRDFGGLPGFPSNMPSIINRSGVMIKEFPICTMSLFGSEIAFSGGGYFRLFPEMVIQKRITESDYFIGYFHIEDLLRKKVPFPTRNRYESYFKERGTLGNRIKRYIKSNVGKKGAYEKLKHIIKKNDFISLSLAEKKCDWKIIVDIENNKIVESTQIGDSWMRNSYERE